MPHSKCSACRIRLSTPGAAHQPVGDLCPGCGALLEPVGSLVEVIGFRRVTRRPDGVDFTDAVAAALPRPDPRR